MFSQTKQISRMALVRGIRSIRRLTASWPRGRSAMASARLHFPWALIFSVSMWRRVMTCANVQIPTNDTFESFRKIRFDSWKF